VMSECPTCSGRGHVCIDDVCCGGDECFHGDSRCPTCFGDPDWDWGDDTDDDYPYDEDDAMDDSLHVERDERER
jgi:hypothetical protein